MAIGEATVVTSREASLLARRTPAYLALLSGMLAISFTAIFTKWAAMPGPAAAAWRMTIAAMILSVPFAWRLRARRRAARLAGDAGCPSPGLLGRRSTHLALLGGVWFGINLALLSSALLLISAATATLLDNTAPIWVGIGAMLLFRERLRWPYWAGLALALVGAAVVTGFNPAGNLTFQRGDLMAAAGAVFYATYLLTTQRARRDLDTVSTLWFMEVGAAITLLALVFVLGVPLTGYGPRSYAALAAVALISQTAGWLLINYALGFLPASTAVIVLLGQPIVTALLSIPLLGEGLSLHQVTGGAVVLTGIYLCVRQNQRSA